MRSLVGKGSNVNCEARDKSKPILKAIEKDYSKIPDELIQNQAPLHCTNEYGIIYSLKISLKCIDAETLLHNAETLLHIAGGIKSHAIVKLFIDNSADPFKKNKNSKLSLVYAKVILMNMSIIYINNIRY